ncbi:hypothetical protein [Streptomyces sp. URMC 129]|uniref:hypothetical protein n=1 Tax=Streptomyces sp. URMC 129 TaxID=3423407 RepID=UPI003F196CA0
MTDSEDDTGQPTPGSVPHSWRTALFWRWSRDLRKHRELRDGFLKVLQAIGGAADASGRLRFSGDGKPIKLSAIAAAACVDEKDARRYLEGAEAAGVVRVEGGQGRGRSTLYALVLSPFPDWGGAALMLRCSRRRRPEPAPPPWRDTEKKNGGPTPEPNTAPDETSSGDRPPNQLGGPTPELPDHDTDSVRGTDPRPSSGDRPPTSSGDRPRYIPGTTHEQPHDEVSVEPQPPTGAPPTLCPAPPPAAPPAIAVLGAVARCPDCGGNLVTLSGRTACGACARRNRAPRRRRNPRTA